MNEPEYYEPVYGERRDRWGVAIILAILFAIGCLCVGGRP